MAASNRLSTFLAAGVSLGLAALTAGGCASAKKKEPELSKLEGRKVALIEVEGEQSQRATVEVALINQLSQRGTFILVPKQDVQAARTAPDQDSTDWKGIAKRAGADVALRAKVLEFVADEREGYSSEEVEDSQLAEERGDDGKTQRLYKVRAMTGRVKVQMDFALLPENDFRTGLAEHEAKVEAEAKTGGARLPPKIRFLEQIANEAFKKFFDKYD